jgi:hypothetical protein
MYGGVKNINLVNYRKLVRKIGKVRSIKNDNL